MNTTKTSISKAGSYQEIGEFWDSHDLTEVWERTESVEFSVNIQSQHKYYAIEHDLSNKIVEIAKKQGVSAGTLVNLWIQEKIRLNQ